jgi:RNA polymerase sigma-70 factor (ECF subfamily)
MLPNEETLLAQLRGGDREALANYLVMRRPQLMAFIDRRLGTALRRKIELDDLFQEVSAEAVRSLDDIDLSDRKPFNWLCQIAERRIIDAHRRFFGSQKRDAGREVSLNAVGRADTTKPGLVNLLVASMTSASQVFSRDQKQMRMLSALQSLPADQREVLQFRYLDSLPTKEIAERVGKTDGAVRVMLTRALAKLQRMLDTEASEEVSGE